MSSYEEKTHNSSSSDSSSVVTPRLSSKLRRWSIEEDKIVLENRPSKETAERLGRTVAAVEQRRSRLNSAEKQSPRRLDWPKETKVTDRNGNSFIVAVDSPSGKVSELAHTTADQFISEYRERSIKVRSDCLKEIRPLIIKHVSALRALLGGTIWRIDFNKGAWAPHGTDTLFLKQKDKRLKQTIPMSVSELLLGTSAQRMCRLLERIQIELLVGEVKTLCDFAIKANLPISDIRVPANVDPV